MRRVEQTASGVMAFIDYENLRRSIVENFLESVSAGRIAKVIKEVAEELGEFRGGTFFGDWTRRPADAREVEENGFRAQNVLLTRSRKDRSDVVMALHIDDAIREKADFSILILGSGDADFAEVIRRARERGKRPYVCAVGGSAARELLMLSEGVFPLEVRLKLTPKTAQLPIMGVESMERRAHYWRPFVSRLISLQETHPYVVRNYLRNSILEPSMGCGETGDEKDAFLNKALDEGIVIPDEIPNPKLAGRTVVTFRLNRENELVKQILSKI